MKQRTKFSPPTDLQEQPVTELLNQLQQLDAETLDSVLQNYPEISLSQRRLWTLQRLDPDSNAYNVPVLLKIEGALDLVALKATIHEVVRRHEILRSIFYPTNDSARILLLEDSVVSMGVKRALKKDWAHPEKSNLLRDFVSAAFDLTKQPGFRARLFDYNNNQFVLALVFHHLVIDGWSLGLFFNELKQLYSSKLRGVEASLGEPIQYAGFSKWEHALNESGEFHNQGEFWKKLLDADAPQSNLCGNRENNYGIKGLADYAEISVPPEFAQKIRNFSRQKKCSIFPVLMAGLHALNFRYTRSERVVIGTTVFNRKLVAFEQIVGFFVNTIAIPSFINDEISFTQLLEELTQTIQQANENNGIPFDQVVSLLDMQKRADNQLFRIALEYQRSPYESLELDGLRVQWLEANARCAKFDLTFFFFESAGNLRLKIEFDSKSYTHSQASRIGNNLLDIMKSAFANPESPVSKLIFSESICPSLEGQISAIPETDLFSEFEKAALAYPERVAIQANGKSILFGDAVKSAKSIAAHIQKAGLNESLIGIIADRSLDSILAVLGIWASGNGYVPIDPKGPSRRNDYIIENSALKMVLKSKFFEFEHEKVNVNSIEDLEVLDTLNFQPKASACPYVIYTSGSTGNPKACRIRHSSVLNLMIALEEEIGMSGSQPLKVSLNAPLCFDASVQQLVMLLRGHTLCVVPEDIRTDAIEFANWIENNNIQILDCTPSHLKLLMLESTALKNVKNVLVGGESISQELWDKMRSIPNTKFFNVYGPTECTVDSTIHLIENSSDRPVIGKPIRNTSLVCVDSELNPLPLEIPGELVISGSGVGAGYQGDTVLTSKKFINSTSYLTGDLVRFLENGTVEFLGRMDDQVKIRGHRIELSGIEHFIRQEKSLLEAVVLLERSSEQTFLHAYVIPVEGQEISFNALRSHLRDYMPEYCIPSKFSTVTEIPLTPNGKVDKEKLRSQSTAVVGQANPEITQIAPPINLLEIQLLRLWRIIFGHEQFDVNSDFFHLGGQSLMAAQLLNQIRSKFNINVPSYMFFQNPSIRQLASEISNFRPVEDEVHLEVINRGNGNHIPIFCFHPMGGNVLVYGPLGSMLNGQNPVYAIRSKAINDPASEFESYEVMCEHYGREILKCLQYDRCYLLGWSMGGLIALKVAEFLEARNIRVLGIDLWDCGFKEQCRPNPEKLDLMRGYASVMNSLASTVGRDFEEYQLKELQAILSTGTEYNFGCTLLHWVKKLWKLELHIDSRFVDRVAKLSSLHANLFHNYSIPNLKADIHSIWSSHSLKHKLLFKNFWGKYTSGHFTEEILDQGTHYTMMSPKNLAGTLLGLENRLALANLKINTLTAEPEVQGTGKCREIY